MSKTSKKRKGYLYPIEGSELQGSISKGWKYVRIRDYDYSKKRYTITPEYFKKVRVWICSYCGQEAHFTAIFPHSGYETIERLCKKCVEVYEPVSDSTSSNLLPVCNL